MANMDMEHLRGPTLNKKIKKIVLDAVKVHKSLSCQFFLMLAVDNFSHINLQAWLVLTWFTFNVILQSF